MLTLSQAAILEKNKITSANVWLILLEISISATTAGQLPTVLRLVRNTENIVWNSQLSKKRRKTTSFSYGDISRNMVSV